VDFVTVTGFRGFREFRFLGRPTVCVCVDLNAVSVTVVVHRHVIRVWLFRFNDCYE